MWASPGLYRFGRSRQFHSCRERLGAGCILPPWSPRRPTDRSESYRSSCAAKLLAPDTCDGQEEWGKVSNLGLSCKMADFDLEKMAVLFIQIPAFQKLKMTKTKLHFQIKILQSSKKICFCQLLTKQWKIQLLERSREEQITIMIRYDQDVFSYDNFLFCGRRVTERWRLRHYYGDGEADCRQLIEPTQRLINRRLRMSRASYVLYAIFPLP